MAWSAAIWTGATSCTPRTTEARNLYPQQKAPQKRCLFCVPERGTMKKVVLQLELLRQLSQISGVEFAQRQQQTG